MSAPAGRVLILGGARSGKSRYAEQLLGDAAQVVYVATAAERPDDPEWAERLRRHRLRRPPSWTTLETADLAGALRSAPPAATLLVDSVTAWLSGAMDEARCWDDELTGSDALARLAPVTGALLEAWMLAPSVVAVSDEVGGGIVPPTRSGRLFRDALGELNQRLAAAADSVQLVVAGLPLRLR